MKNLINYSEYSTDEGIKTSLLTGIIALSSIIPHSANAQFFKHKTNTEQSSKSIQSGETSVMEMSEEQLQDMEKSLDKKGFEISVGTPELSKIFNNSNFQGKTIKFVVTSSASNNENAGQMQNQQKIRTFINGKYKMGRVVNYHTDKQVITIAMVI